MWCFIFFWRGGVRGCVASVKKKSAITVKWWVFTHKSVYIRQIKWTTEGESGNSETVYILIATHQMLKRCFAKPHYALGIHMETIILKRILAGVFSLFLCLNNKFIFFKWEFALLHNWLYFGEEEKVSRFGEFKWYFLFTMTTQRPRWCSYSVLILR